MTPGLGAHARFTSGTFNMKQARKQRGYGTSVI